MKKAKTEPDSYVRKRLKNMLWEKLTVNFTLPAAPEVDRNEADRNKEDPNEEDSDDEYRHLNIIEEKSQEMDYFEDGTTIQQLEEKIVQGICPERKDSGVQWSI
jgi:hypothetical protein